MIRIRLCCMSMIVFTMFSTVVRGQVATPARARPQSSSEPKPDWLATVLHAAVPRTYENRKRWGTTKKVIVGVRGKLFDPRFRRKELRHGTWRRSEVRIVEPEKRLKLALSDVKHAGPARHEFHLSASARVHIILQQQEWRRDLRIYSVSGEAIADLELDLDCEMTMKVEPGTLLPSITLEPVVKDVDIRLKRFRLLSLGDADGPVVREVGNLFEGFVRDELKDKEKSIVKKINRSITKRKDHLKLSVADLAAGAWTKHFQMSKLIGNDKENGTGDGSRE